MVVALLFILAVGNLRKFFELLANRLPSKWRQFANLCHHARPLPSSWSLGVQPVAFVAKRLPISPLSRAREFAVKFNAPSHTPKPSLMSIYFVFRITFQIWHSISKSDTRVIYFNRWDFLFLSRKVRNILPYQIKIL